MADWTYQVIDPNGKEKKGNIVAETELEAKNKLKLEGNVSVLPSVHKYDKCRCHNS